VFSYHPPASVELYVGVKQGHHRGRGSSPATHTRADQALLLTVPHHLMKSGCLALVSFTKSCNFSFNSSERKRERERERGRALTLQ